MENVEIRIEIARLLKEVLMLLRQNTTKEFRNFGMDITAPQAMIVGSIMHFGNMKISELSSKLGFSNSTVSGIIDRLEAQGLVKRNRSKEDRRVVYVSVTPKIEKIHEEVHNRANKNIENIMQKGTPEDLKKILEGLSTLKKLLN